jgi:hypothetical protein
MDDNKCFDLLARKNPGGLALVERKGDLALAGRLHE